MLAMAMSALISLILGFTHKRRGEAFLTEAATETAGELATALREKSEIELKKSRRWFIISAIAGGLAVAAFIFLNSL